jgi:hypothetical protein
MISVTITLKTDDGLHISVRKSQTEVAVRAVLGAMGISTVAVPGDLTNLHALAMLVHDEFGKNGAKLTIEYDFS